MLRPGLAEASRARTPAACGHAMVRVHLDGAAERDTFRELATTTNRPAFYADYEFEITPPTDDRPFFFHFFRWEQTPKVIENLGPDTVSAFLAETISGGTLAACPPPPGAET